MNYAELKKHLKGDLSSIYYFYGDEVYLLNYMTTRLTDMIVDDFAEFNHLLLTKESLSVQCVSDFFEAYPVMSERKLLHIKDASVFSGKSGDSDILLSLLLDVPEYVTVLITEGAPDKRGKMYKSLEKKMTICDFAYLEKAELKSHVLKKLSSEKKDMSPSDLEHFIDLTGPDLTNIRLQAEKLIAYTGERVRITKEDMDKNIAPPLLSRIYDISEAVLDKKSDYVFHLIADLKKSGESGIRILSIMGSYFSDLYRAYVLSRENMSYGEMLAQMKLPPQRKFVADKMFKRAKSVNPQFIKECVNDCSLAENSVKNGLVSEWQALELALIKFLNYKISS